MKASAPLGGLPVTVCPSERRCTYPFCACAISYLPSDMPHPDVFTLRAAAVEWDVAARANLREASTGVTAATVAEAKAAFLDLLGKVDPAALAGYLVLTYP